MHNIVIVGGGFAGLWAALSAARQIDANGGDVRVTLISKDSFLTIRPRLYEADPSGLRVSLHDSLDPVGVQLIEGTVQGIDAHAQTVMFELSTGKIESFSYDRLILTAGSVQRALPVTGAAEFAWNIDTYDAAVALDHQLRKVAREERMQDNNTIVIVGGGFTGIELATEMRSRLARHSNETRAADFRVVLIEKASEIGPDLGANPRADIERALHNQGVDVLTATEVIQFESNAVTLNDQTTIATTTAIITAGLAANELVQQFTVDKDELGRLLVDNALHVAGVRNVFAAGDVARALVDESNVALMSCQHAMPMGRYAGYNAAQELLGLPLRDYRQADYVTCLDLGPEDAIFTRGWDRQVELRGIVAKNTKQKINTQWIYPPLGDRAEILRSADIDAKRRR